MESREIGFLIKSINDKIKVKADADLKQHGLTFAQCRILGFLHERGGQATQKEIEDYFQIAHPTVVGLVGRMEKNGFVETWFDPADGRSKLVRTTKKAEQQGKDMEHFIHEQEIAMTAGLSPEEVSELKHMLEVIYHNMT